MSFEVEPQQHDQIFIKYPTWKDHVLVYVQCRQHVAGGDNDGCMIYGTVTFNDYDAMIAAFDLLKDTVSIEQLIFDDSNPPPYYIVYRILLWLWGKRTFDLHHDNAKSLATLVHAMCLAGDSGFDQVSLSRLLELVHKTIIDAKHDARHDEIELLWLVKECDRYCEFCSLIVDVTKENALAVAKHLFDSIKSVPLEKLPASIRTNP